MFRSRHFPCGLPGATVAIALFGVLLVVGCSSDSVTMPAQLAAADSDSPTALQLPPRGRGIPTPTDVSVTDLCATGAVVRWASPGRGFHALIRVDGVIVGRVRARDGYYLDTLAKACGAHTWGVCFTRPSTNEFGAEVLVTEVMPGTIMPDPKVPPDRPEADK